MKEVVKVEEKSKVKKAQVKEVKGLDEYVAMEVYTWIALIQKLIPLVLIYMEELLRVR
jgi:hypothetical protein